MNEHLFGWSFELSSYLLTSWFFPSVKLEIQVFVPTLVPINKANLRKAATDIELGLYSRHTQQICLKFTHFLNQLLFASCQHWWLYNRWQTWNIWRCPYVDVAWPFIASTCLSSFTHKCRVFICVRLHSVQRTRQEKRYLRLSYTQWRVLCFSRYSHLLQAMLLVPISMWSAVVSQRN